ncbi:MAG: hypothetical protein IT317_19500 [Anaerolineales bacterium]|nr:hypothetical protein [Anaerolineales bacterium]
MRARPPTLPRSCSPGLAALTLLLAASLACQTLRPMSAQEQFIQGTWGWGQDFGDGHGSYLTWTFAAGSFTVEGYPPLHQTGRYAVSDSTNDTLTLALTDQSGDWGTADRAVIVVIDEAAGSLTIENNGPYNRVTP